MTTTGGGSCCRCCFSFILTSGFTALFMWLSLRTSNPTASIQQFYLPALNITTDNYVDNGTIYFDLKLQNGMNDKSVHYGNINLTFYYNNSTLPVANYTFPSFHQGRKKTAHRRNTVDTVGLPWAEALDAVAGGSRVGFRVVLATRVRFKILLWYTKRHRFVVSGVVEVDGSGRKVGKKGVKLKSGAPSGRWVGMGAPALVSTFVVMILLV